MKFKRRHGEYKQGCVLSQSLPAIDSRADTLSLPLLPAFVFVIRDIVRHPRRCCSENLFVNRNVREQGRS
jgi:hypothetical protein